MQIATIGYLIKQSSAKPKTTKSSPRRSMILDSCGLIDGRIIDVLSAGFAPDKVIVPQFIVSELQLLADGRDAHKRERARFGLDVVKQLQASAYCEVDISTELMDSNDPTDDRLVALAKMLHAQLYTTDYNLSKVAEIGGVNVLNVNELAQSLRPTALPGERRTIKILEKGSGQDQGVGYLSDGTMIVVNGARKSIGKTVEVEISRTFQTVAGKMLFGSLINQSTTQTSPAPQVPAATTQPKIPSIGGLQAQARNQTRTPRIERVSVSPNGERSERAVQYRAKPKYRKPAI